MLGGFRAAEAEFKLTVIAFRRQPEDMEPVLERPRAGHLRAIENDYESGVNAYDGFLMAHDTEFREHHDAEILGSTVIGDEEPEKPKPPCF